MWRKYSFDDIEALKDKIEGASDDEKVQL